MGNQRAAAVKDAAPTGGFVPISIKTKDRAKAPRVPLFEIDDQVFTIPEPIPANYAAKFLQRLRVMGENLAAMRTVDELLGPEALDALAGCEEITQEEMQAIFDELNTRLLGSVMKALGN